MAFRFVCWFLLAFCLVPKASCEKSENNFVFLFSDRPRTRVIYKNLADIFNDMTCIVCFATDANNTNFLLCFAGVRDRDVSVRAELQEERDRRSGAAVPHPRDPADGAGNKYGF